jgi:hypothetical protein
MGLANDLHFCEACKGSVPLNVFVKRGAKVYHITCYEQEVLQPRIDTALNEQAEKFRQDMATRKEVAAADRAAIRAECLAELKRATIQEGAVGVDKFINKVEKEGKRDAIAKAWGIGPDSPLSGKQAYEQSLAQIPPTPEEIKSKEDWTRAAEEVCKLAKAHFGPIIPGFLPVARFMHEKMTERKLFVQWVEIEPEKPLTDEDKKRADEFMAQLNALKPKEE